MAQVTLYPAAGASTPVDGHVFRGPVNETFSTIRAGAGSSANNTGDPLDVALLRSTTTTDQYQYLTRAIFGFGLSGIPSGSKINSATFSVYGTGKAADLGTATTLDIVQATPGATDALVAGDYSNLLEVVFADMAYASYSTTGYNDFTINASGITYLESKIGTNAFLGARLGWDTDNSFGGTWSSAADMRYTCNFADAAGTSTDPKLVIDYTEPSRNSYAYFM